MSNEFDACLFTVCIGFLNKFSKRLRETEVDPGNQDKLELEIRKSCREAKGKDERFVSCTSFTSFICTCVFLIATFLHSW